MERNFALHITFYLSTALFKIPPHSKTITNTANTKNWRYLVKTTLVIDLLLPNSFANIPSGHLPVSSVSIVNFEKVIANWDYFLRIFFKTSNSINSRDSGFSKVIMIFIRTTEVLIFNVISEKDLYLNTVKKIRSSCGVY